MTDRLRQVLMSLRCDASIIRDSSFSACRDVAMRILATIDAELTTPSEPEARVHEPEIIDPAKLPNSVLLRELAKRIQAIRHVRKLCFRCKTNPARARGLCKRCYKKAYRRGEIKNASR